MKGLRLYKYEKLCSKKIIEDLFAAKNNSIKSYPIRIIYSVAPAAESPSQFFISVPKRKLRHAVDRVLMRRRIREAYRLNRNIIIPSLKKENKSAYIAIIYMADSIVDYKIIEEKIKNVLTDLATVIENKQSLNPTQSIK